MAIDGLCHYGQINRIGFPTKMVTHDMKSPDGVIKSSCDFFGGLVFNEAGAKSLILALPWVAGFKKEAADITYVFRCAYHGNA
jgi:hypothetical protein